MTFSTTAGGLTGAHRRGMAIGAILMVIVLMAAVAGAIAVAVRSNVSTSGQASIDMQANALVQQADNLQTEYERLSIENGSGYVPDISQFPKQNVNADAMAIPANTWMYTSAKIIINGLGTGNAQDAFYLIGLKESVCRSINHRVSGTDINAAPIYTGVLNLAWMFPGAVDFTGVPALNGVTEQCVLTNGGYYNYYKMAVIK